VGARVIGHDVGLIAVGLWLGSCWHDVLDRDYVGAAFCAGVASFVWFLA
jgi:hypothetical protein